MKAEAGSGWINLYDPCGCGCGCVRVDEWRGIINLSRNIVFPCA